jgi:recombination associated protein RdgC
MRNPFKHVRLYRSDDAFRTLRNKRPFELSESLIARDLTGHEFTRNGIIDFLEEGQYIREIQGGVGYVFVVEHAVRVVPASVIRDTVDKRIKYILETEGRKVKPRERSDLIYEVEQELAPKAFVRKSLAFATVVEGLVMIHTSSSRIEEGVLHLLIAMLKSNGVDNPDIEPVRVLRPVRDAFTAILAGTHDPQDFELTDRAEFENETADGPARRASLRKASLTNGEVEVLLKEGYSATKLGLRWIEDEEETLQFHVNEDLQISAIKFAEPSLNRSIPVEREEGIGDFDSRAWIIARVLPRTVRDLLEMLNNENDEDEL